MKCGEVGKRFCPVFSSLRAPLTLEAATVTPLHEDWRLQSACKVQRQATRLRTRTFRRRLVEDLGPEHGSGRASRCRRDSRPLLWRQSPADPRGKLSVGTNFSNQPMPADSPYRCGWWYLKEFTGPASSSPDGRIWLHFGGINYRGEIWLNGKKIADRPRGGGRLPNLRF